MKNKWEKAMMNIMIGKKVVKLLDVLPNFSADVVSSITDRARDRGTKLEEMELIRKYYPAHLKEVDKAERAEVSIISSITEDRDKEIVWPKGMIKKNYERNPVVLFGHDYRSFPVGVNLWLKAGDQNIIGKSRYTFHEVANTIWGLYLDEIPLGKSIGFLPYDTIEKYDDEEGLISFMDDHDITYNPKDLPERIFTKWELLEYSVVPVPANPDCVTLMVGKTNSEMMKKYFTGFDFKKMKEADIENLESYRKEYTEEQKDGEKKEGADDFLTKDELQKFFDEKVTLTDILHEWKENETMPIETAEKLVMLKVGAVLNKKNKERLKTAQELIGEVLKSAEDTEEEEGKGPPVNQIKGFQKGEAISEDMLTEHEAVLVQAIGKLTARIDTVADRINLMGKVSVPADRHIVIRRDIPEKKESEVIVLAPKGITRIEGERIVEGVKREIKEGIEQYIKRNIKGEMD